MALPPVGHPQQQPVTTPSYYSIGNPPPEWVYEPADSSVGLFFEGWYHAIEDCADEALDPEQVVVEEHFEGEGANRRLVSTLAYRCPCGATMTVVDHAYDPDLPDDLDPWGLDSWPT